MSTVQEIQSAIEGLSIDDRWDLIHRLHDELWEKWDAEIEADSAAGKFDALISGIEDEIAQGKTRPLHEIIGD